ncbi:MAG: glucosamine-6-phosphate deaminase [Bacteroidetes bacterium]|nr:glucosamine-6-phosphate deaminase [Bacteroidota bacterium]
MELMISPTAEAQADWVAEMLIDLIRTKPTAVICMASGNSPAKTCAAFVQKVKEEKIDVSGFRFVGLDEWVGVPPLSRGACRFDFEERIFKPLGIEPERCLLFNGVSGDLSGECRKMDEGLARVGGIDLMVVGLGLNGHIGFNEPGVSWGLGSHVIELEKETAVVGQKYFDQPMDLKYGITLGFRHLMDARKVVLVVQGKSKAEVLKRVVQEKPNQNCPASILQTHPAAIVSADVAAAELVKG